MSIRLLAIKFNHNSSSHTTDALTIRKNKTDAISVPEWQDGVSINPEDSLAAYAILPTTGKTLTIQARFHSTGAPGGTAQIRAIDPTILHGWTGRIIRFLYSFWRVFYGNVLGEIKMKGVTFNTTGNSGYITFEIDKPKLDSAGVGIYTVQWQWQYKSSGGSWRDMQLSKHKIYVVLETPKEVWNQTAGSDHLPWAEVLDYSCSWARGTKTRDAAATKITEEIYALGNSVIEYDCPGGGDTHYCYGPFVFDCTKFIERMRGGTGNGQYVNCTDCAAMVVTFSNILGCELWCSQMEGPWGVGFALNPILAIGSSTWQSACGWSGFGYHEVAWKDNCDVNDELFDACLQLDGDSDPTTAPHVPLLPTNIKFGTCSGLTYRTRLSPPVTGGCDNCVPEPEHKRRRTIK